MIAMRLETILRGALAALAVAAFGAVPALAQGDSQPAQQQAAKKPVGPTIMKTFGGWDVRCYPVSTPAPCDAWEAIAFKKSKQLAASVSVVYVPMRDEYLMQFIVPLDVDLSKGANVIAGAYTSPALPYHHCDRIGCFIAVAGASPVVDKLKGQKTMKIHVAFFRGKVVDIGVPLAGFDQARAAMVELARQKAVAPKPQEPAQPANP